MSAVRVFTVLLLAAFTTPGTPRVAQAFRPATQAATPSSTAKAVTAAKSFLATLNDQQRATVVLPLNAKTRTVWSNLPTGVTMQVGANERNGLKLGALTAAQQDAALALVAATLSPTGFRKVMNIVNADQQLEVTTAPQRAAGNRVRFGRAEYSIAIL